jgi:hypothetical protein
LEKNADSHFALRNWKTFLSVIVMWHLMCPISRISAVLTKNTQPNLHCSGCKWGTLSVFFIIAMYCVCNGISLGFWFAFYW